MEKKLTSIKKTNPHQDLIQARKESMKKINESNEKSFEWLNIMGFSNKWNWR